MNTGSVRSEASGPSGPSAVLALQCATHTTLQVLAAALASLELTASEISALANLAEGRQRTVSDLAGAVGIRPTTLTGVLDRLERRGHIVRAAHPTDRRAVVIDLTAAGWRAATTVRQAVTDLEAGALAGVPADQIAGFHAVLRALTGGSA